MKKRKILFPVLCCALLLSACVQGTREEDADKQGSTTGVQIEEKDGKEFFVFSGRGREYIPVRTAGEGSAEYL